MNRSDDLHEILARLSAIERDVRALWVQEMPVVGGGGVGAPANALYVCLATHGDLSAERVLVPGGGLTGVDSGANNNYTLNVGAGSGIDVAANSVGLGGDTILLYDSGGNPVAEFAATSAGLDQASAAATSGDVVWLPAVAIAGNHTLTAGVHYIGVSRWASILTGQITLGNGTTLENVSITRTANDANDLVGLIRPAGGTAKVQCCDVTVTQSGAGGAYAASVGGGGGDLELWLCYLDGDSAGGVGYGGFHAAGSGNLYCYACRVVGSTAPFNL